MPFSPARLGIARKRRMLNKKALAEACEVTQHTAGKWESGESDPTSDNVATMSKLIGFPI